MYVARFLSVVLVILCAMIAACSSNGRNYTNGHLSETLETEILPNTSKMFVYRLRTPERKMFDGVYIERNSGAEHRSDRGGIDVDRSTPLRLHENAGYVVKRLGYCREGFLQIDYSVSRHDLWIKGECKEGATDDDIKKFGTKKILPIAFSE